MSSLPNPDASDEALVRALEEDPDDRAAKLAWADWAEEAGRDDLAATLRLLDALGKWPAYGGDSRETVTWCRWSRAGRPIDRDDHAHLPGWWFKATPAGTYAFRRDTSDSRYYAGLRDAVEAAAEGLGTFLALHKVLTRGPKT